MVFGRRVRRGALRPVLAFVGTRFLGFFHYTGEIAYLFHDAVWWAMVAPYRGKAKLNYSDTLQQKKLVSVRSFGIVGTVIFFVGMILAFQMGYVLKTLGVTEYTADITGVAMVRELGPLIVSMILTGYMGAAITTEIGSMVVSEEVLALRCMAMDPIRFLVVPRVLAAMAMLPLVCLLAIYVGIFGGFVVSYFLLGIEAEKYLHRTVEAISFKDVASGLVKAEAFAILVALISCHEGFSVRGGVEGVGQATTRCVVRCVISIIICDLIFTALFFFL